MDLIQKWYDDRYYCIPNFDISLIDLDLGSRSQECEKEKKPLRQLSHKHFNRFEWNFGKLLRLVNMMNLKLTLSLVHSIFIGEKPTYMISLENRNKQTKQQQQQQRDTHRENFDIGLYSDIYRPISFKLGMMIEITKIYICVSVWMTLTFIQGHSCMKNRKTLVSILWLF